MASETTLRIVITEATDLPRAGSFLGGSKAFVSVKVDGEKPVKSEAVDATSTARWDFNTEVCCPPDAENVLFEVRRPGMFGQSTVISSCVVRIAAITRLDDEALALWDSSRRQSGALHLSIIAERHGSSAMQQQLPGGLRNQATSSFGAPSTSSFPTASFASATSSRGTGTASGPPGGLTNYGGASSLDPAPAVPGGLVNRSFQGNAAPRGSTASVLTNRAADDVDESPTNSGPPGSLTMSFTRSGTKGLANLASAGDDGTQPNAIPRAHELLGGLAELPRHSDEQRQRLAQILELLRKAPRSDLDRDEAQEVVKTCEKYIQAIFDDALVARNERDTNQALWLAGRLPMPDDDVAQITLQDRLRQEWDKAKMKESFESAKSMLGAAAQTSDGLEAFMDQLDLAEFHAGHDKKAQQQSTELLKALQPKLAKRLRDCLKTGELEQVESAIGVIGAAKVSVLGLLDVEQELQRLRSLDMLRAALSPSPGQIGFPELKRRQLRHAMMSARTLLAEDSSGNAAAALQQLLMYDMLPSCLKHSGESTTAMLRSCLELRISEKDLWDRVHKVYTSLPDASKQEAMDGIKQLCKEMSKDTPKWLISPEQAKCQQALQFAIECQDASELQRACQMTMKTEGAQAVCQREMEKAIEMLRAQFKLPEGWDVASMIESKETRFLAKNEVKDRRLLALFAKVLTDTAQPHIRTRDRRGGVPQNFHAVRAVQVLNASVWANYVKRRGQIAQQCQALRTRTDAEFWRDPDRGLNGTIMSTDSIRSDSSSLSSDGPLETAANEFWLLHGTSHAAAEGITTDDFDMTRASPSGLFGAGVYFGESISKADEYVQGKQEGGRELFPVLLCRVCLGNVNYCAEKLPDRRKLEESCLKEPSRFHSVLGDRKKIRGTFREFIVYDSLQAFPAYIIYYERKY